MGISDGQLNDSASICHRRSREHEHINTLNSDHERAGRNSLVTGDNAFSQHCDYFDLDSDGIIWPLDTYKVCRAWGWKFLTALFFTGAIHFVQSYGTIPGIMPDPFWRIWKENLHRNNHGSSTMSFDRHGGFETSRLHEFFEENDLEKKGGITIWELWRGLNMQALPFDLFGQVSNFFEWLFTYLLVWPEDGMLREKDALAVCTGTMFRRKAEGDSERPRPQPCDSPLFTKQVLSLVIVDIVVLPAIAAGMCYFVLRAMNDAVVVWRYLRKKRSQEVKSLKRRWEAYSGSSRNPENAHPSAAGLLGLLIVVGLTKVVLTR